MTNQTLGHLLDEYEISSFDDFRQLDYSVKDDFLKRVTNIATSQSKDQLHKALDHIAHVPGLKMCFRVTQSTRDEWRNVPNDIFAKKLALYTSRTVITFPFHYIDYRREADLRALLTLLCITHPFLKENYITILPAYTNDHTYNQKLKRLMSANFRLDKLEEQFEEIRYATNSSNILLPILESISAQDIINVRTNEILEFQKAEMKLEKDLMIDKFDERKFLSELYEIHERVQTLDELVHDIQDAVTKGAAIRLLLIAMSTVGSLVIAPSVAMPIISALGGPTIYGIAEYLFEQRKQYKNIKRDNFYVFWKIEHPDNIISLRALFDRYIERTRSKSPSLVTCPITPDAN